MSNIYGNWLRSQREAQGLTQQELADLALMTRSHIAHIEAGRRLPSREDARRLDKALGTGNVLASFLPDEDAAVAEYFETTRLLEQQATMIQEFALSYVPGILQTASYARTVFRLAFPPPSDDECDRLVVTRLERAKVLDGARTPVVWTLLDEAVLRRPVGGATVMAEQLKHLVCLVESERVRLHVLPFDLGFHPLLPGMVTLMSFEDQPPVAYSEGAAIGKLHDSPDVVQRLQGAYALAMGDALPLRESLAVMNRYAEEYEHHD
ncbi:hypothetical protein SRB5_55940 [Streptomyces sp. RB5]|uniref:HTH cro/C1-type domain-containing protein n=1 Tax=Streptomyces smaragdinus TaxID=2585196 RepID=A0A7K0CQY6_9ACTN|nr:helix-turn-helix transcriptional regulator [Streptomyces smaragdinus]MQY15412.1 hypothetical protein [Streptomyces smaragdinus]